MELTINSERLRYPYCRFPAANELRVPVEAPVRRGL